MSHSGADFQAEEEEGGTDGGVVKQLPPRSPVLLSQSWAIEVSASGCPMHKLSQEEEDRRTLHGLHVY